ncbi:hypothetical protein AJ88_19055 [Mesorhizobium amorphae CCBAU 01583]|nr:hypothetical protein AJ88_19055 [Mesorhizobium amorphae CCBAU 01583]
MSGSLQRRFCQLLRVTNFNQIAEYCLPRRDATNLLYAELAWTEFAVKLKRLLEPFVREFETLLVEAPVEDQPYIQLLLDHEIALFAFAQAEGEESSDGQIHLDNFLQRHKALLRNAS